ncbi:DciA family protein [Corynebacterium tapiri]|uniref:DUF721 domain-containing protein n=1 Tax=Corynebacterium tapiri TaxID=1448266 RepID=A0A5C4U381_9CORY|nr:DciA family protein [Corynebacterium tapiri]TNL96853.1 DUF721 domain-containing protein [Corynebacterium tapiri]
MTSEQAGHDPVADAFEHIRAEARKRGHKLPRLDRPARKVKLADVPEATIPGVSPDQDVLSNIQRPRYRGPGRMTGPDGRRQAKSMNVPALGAVLGKEIAQRGWSHELAVGWVSGHWEDLVGEQIAAHTKVEMVKDGALFITCTSTAWATNLKYMQRTILQSIAAKIGNDVITQLKIFGPSAPSWRKGALHVKGRGPRDTYG